MLKWSYDSSYILDYNLTFSNVMESFVNLDLDNTISNADKKYKLWFQGENFSSGSIMFLDNGSVCICNLNNLNTVNGTIDLNDKENGCMFNYLITNTKLWEQRYRRVWSKEDASWLCHNAPSSKEDAKEEECALL